ncbi:MAG: META domain-containing protein [Odoribacter sp.]
MKNLLVLFCILFAVVGCHSSKNIAKLNDVKWVLQTMNGKEIKLSDQNSEIFIQFNEVDKRANGRAGCNRFFGNYEMEDQQLKFSPMGATRMACPDLQLESEFFQMLDEVDTYQIKDNQLSFNSKGNVVAVFKKTDEVK